MTINQPMTELALRLRITQKAKDQLTEQAARSGRPVDAVASELLERAMIQTSLDELMAPVKADIAASGITEEELMSLGRAELDALRRERRARSS